ncbi:centrosomal protein of 83 kDa-like [Haliotis cracherodii]|uniref:centrosomal protein of 83 kDa-like n=1 Tax=Haliotis cracherodii TaxID=6455 RepID=UPI0039E9B41A
MYPPERRKCRKLLSPVLEADERESKLPSPRTPDDHQDLLVQYMDLKSQVGDLEESLLDHLLNENQKLREENERQARQLREENTLRQKTESERQDYRLEYFNYRLSYTMAQAEVQELKQTLEGLAGYWEKEKQTEMEQRKKLEEELAALQRQTAPLTCHTPANKRTSSSSVGPPVQPRKARRPYTGKSKDKVPSNISHVKTDLSASGDKLMMAKDKNETKLKVTSSVRSILKDTKRGQDAEKKPTRSSRNLSVRFRKEMPIGKIRHEM